MSKIDFTRVVANASEETHVIPHKFDNASGPMLEKVHVDMYGNMIIRSADDKFILIPINEAWGMLDKLARFAKKVGFHEQS